MRYILPCAAPFFLPYQEGFSSSAASVRRRQESRFHIFIPTTLMGGTLPTLCQAWPEGGHRPERPLGLLYGANLAGAVVGAIVTTFLFLPAWGISRTIILAASLNLLAAIIAVSVALQKKRGERSCGQSLEQFFTDDDSTALRLRRLVIFTSNGLAGLVAIIEEVIWSRSLRLVVGSSTYALTLMLVPFLLGVGLGSYLVARWSRWIRRPVSVLAILQGAAFLSLYAAIYLYPHLPRLFLFAFPLAGPGEGVFLLQAALAILLLLPLATTLGAVFPLCARVIAPDASAIGLSVGKLYAVQTCGNVLGAVLAISWISHLGLRRGLLGAGGIHLVASAVLWLVAEERLQVRLSAALATTAAIFLAPLVKGEWQPLHITTGVYQSATVLNPLFHRPEDFFRALSRFHLLFYREGPTATVSVYERPTVEPLPHLALTIDGKVDASTGADMATQVLSAHLPLLLHPSAKDICVVGWASGVTVGSALLYPVESLTAIEIEPSVISASLAFDKLNHRPLDDRRLRLVIQDARNVLLLQHRRYDVILSEPSNPWLAGPAKLFTQEFFDLARKRLNRGGIFAQWIQLYGLNPLLLRTEVRTFHSVFPFVFVFQTAEGDLLLLGSDSPLNINCHAVREQLREPSIPDDLARVGVHNCPDLLLRFRLGWREVGTFAGSGPLNTDDNGLLEFGAPKSLYRDTLEENNRLVMSAFGGIASYMSSPGQELAVRLAARAIRQNNWSSAEMFGPEVSGISGSAEAAWVLGELQWKQGNQITAQRQWERGLSIDPYHFGCLMDIALAKQQLANFPDAENYLTQLSQRWPKDPLVALIHGVNRLALKDAPGAARYLAQARKHSAVTIEEPTSDADPYQAFRGRFLPVRILASFYAWQAARIIRDHVSEHQLEKEAESSLERWRADLMGDPSAETRARTLEAVDLLSRRAQVIEPDRTLLEWAGKVVLEPLSHFDRAISAAELGDTTRAQNEFREVGAQVTDEDGLSQMAIVLRKLGMHLNRERPAHP